MTTTAKKSTNVDLVLKIFGAIMTVLIVFVILKAESNSNLQNARMDTMNQSIHRANIKLDDLIIREQGVHDKLNDKIDINSSKIAQVKGNLETHCQMTEKFIDTLSGDIKEIERKIYAQEKGQ